MLIVSLRCSAKVLIEHLSYKPIYIRLTAKLLKLLKGVSTLANPAPKVLKVLTPLAQMSTLAETRMDRDFRLRCSMSILGEHLRRHYLTERKTP